MIIEINRTGRLISKSVDSLRVPTYLKLQSVRAVLLAAISLVIFGLDGMIAISEMYIPKTHHKIVRASAIPGHIGLLRGLPTKSEWRKVTGWPTSSQRWCMLYFVYAPLKGSSMMLSSRSVELSSCLREQLLTSNPVYTIAPQ
jgi:hypothetical protein